MRFNASFKSHAKLSVNTASRQVLIDILLRELTNNDDHHAANLVQADESSSSEGEVESSEGESEREGEALSASDGDIDDGIDDTDWEAVHQNLGEAEQTSSKTWAEFHTHLTLGLGMQVTSEPRPSQTNTTAAGTLVGRPIAFCWEIGGWRVGKVVAGASAKDLRRRLFNYLVQYTSESVHRLHCLNIGSTYNSGAEAEPECWCL